MHEYPITQQIIKIAEKHCIEAKGSKVVEVKLVVGDYSGFIGDSIQMYFDIISEGTLCEGAKIDITHVKPMLLCSVCGEHFYKKPLSFECTFCGGEGNPSEIGKEFYIESIDIE